MAVGTRPEDDPGPRPAGPRWDKLQAASGSPWTWLATSDKIQPRRHPQHPASNELLDRRDELDSFFSPKPHRAGAPRSLGPEAGQLTLEDTADLLRAALGWSAGPAALDPATTGPTSLSTKRSTAHSSTGTWGPDPQLLTDLLTQPLTDSLAAAIQRGDPGLRVALGVVAGADITVLDGDAIDWLKVSLSLERNRTTHPQRRWTRRGRRRARTRRLYRPPPTTPLRCPTTSPSARTSHPSLQTWGFRYREIFHPRRSTRPLVSEAPDRAPGEEDSDGRSHTRRGHGHSGPQLTHIGHVLGPHFCRRTPGGVLMTSRNVDPPVTASDAVSSPSLERLLTKAEAADTERTPSLHREVRGRATNRIRESRQVRAHPGGGNPRSSSLGDRSIPSIAVDRQTVRSGFSRVSDEHLVQGRRVMKRSRSTVAC